MIHPGDLVRLCRDLLDGGDPALGVLLIESIDWETGWRKAGFHYAKSTETMLVLATVSDEFADYIFVLCRGGKCGWLEKRNSILLNRGNQPSHSQDYSWGHPQGTK